MFAAVVYVVTRDRDGFLGFVNAGAEASMVGAIADWFAVTALFKHPLGLPIPHTALIPKRKDDLGRGLEEFVGENFLQEAIIRDRIAAAGISRRVGVWLADPVNARRVVDEVAEVAAIALTKVRDDHIESLVRDALTPRFREEPIAPLLGGLLSEALHDDLHHGLVDLALEELHGWLVENPDTVADVIGERAPWWAPPRLNDAVTGRIHTELVNWVGDIRDDPDHRARQALDSVLAQLADDLHHDPDTQARAEALKERILDNPAVIRSAISLWDALRRALTTSLQDPQGAVRQRMLTEVTAFAARLSSDEQLQSAAGRAGSGRRGLRGGPVRRRGHRRDHAHDRALGRAGGGAPHRAARRPGPAVHPDQRHRGRRPGRRPDPRRQRADRFRACPARLLGLRDPSVGELGT